MLSVIRQAVLPLLALALAACSEVRAGASVPRGDGEGILLALQLSGSGGEHTLEPIAIVTAGGLRNPWDVTDDSAFIARWYAAGTPYAVRVAGMPVGRATVTRALEPGCVDRLAAATVTFDGWMPGEGQVLASDAFGPAARRPLTRRATDAQKRLLAALADSIHKARGLSEERRRTAKVDRVFAVTLGDGEEPALVGSSVITFQADRSEQVHAAMVVAERREGAYRPAYVFYEAQAEGNMQRRSLVDAMDLDGDGMPELVAATLYYESLNYAVLKRGAGGWTEIYKGGGGGC